MLRLQLSAVSLCPLVAAIALTSAHAARAQQWKPPTDAGQSGISKEILASLHDVQRQYGKDAVMMEGQLLGQAIRSGSIVDAVISIPGFEEREGRRYVAFKLETGIIYNDREVIAAARPLRVWADIVEPSLRKFKTLDLPADGVALVFGYAHKQYADESDLRAHLRDNPGDPELVTFYVLSSDVTELTADRITGQQLIDRATVLVNGSPTRLIVEAPTPSP